MVKPKKKNKKNQNGDSEDEVDLDPLAGNTEAQDPAPQSKQGEKKKKKKKDDWEDDVASEIQALSLQTKGNEDSEEEDIRPVKKKKEKKKKKKGDSDEEEESSGRKTKATFQMPMMDDDDTDLPSESDHEEDIEKPRKPKKEDTSKKDKKGKKGKKKGQEEEDLDALLAEVDKPAEKSSKKKKKKKGGEKEEAMETEDKTVENRNQEEEMKAKLEAKVVLIDDIDDDEYDKKMRKKKRKKKEAKSEKTAEGEEKQEDGEDKGEDEEGEDGGTVKTAAQKRKEKMQSDAVVDPGARPKTSDAVVDPGARPKTDYRIRHIYDTVLNHNPFCWNRAKEVVLIVRIDDEQTTEIISNTEQKKSGKKNKHAEELLVDRLNERKETNNPGGSEPDVKPSVVTVYQNNSPCSECTQRLIDYLEENKGVKLILYVTSLFNIRRESCKGEEHYERVDETKHKANYNGLRMLMNHDRCDINPYHKDDWEELLKLVTVSKEVKDELMSDYGNVMAGNDRSRKDEDERIKKDLDHIRTHESD